MFFFRTETDKYKLSVREHEHGDHSIDPEVPSNDPERAIYTAEDEKTRSQLGVSFDEASRVHVSDLIFGRLLPEDDSDQEAWDAYNAAELTAMRKVIKAVNPLLAGQGISPIDTERLVTSHYAGCTMCKCSPGLLTDPVKHPSATLPLDIYITVK